MLVHIWHHESESWHPGDFISWKQSSLYHGLRRPKNVMCQGHHKILISESNWKGFRVVLGALSGLWAWWKLPHSSLTLYVIILCSWKLCPLLQRKNPKITPFIIRHTRGGQRMINVHKFPWKLPYGQETTDHTGDQQWVSICMSC